MSAAGPEDDLFGSAEDALFDEPEQALSSVATDSNSASSDSAEDALFADEPEPVVAGINVAGQALPSVAEAVDLAAPGSSQAAVGVSSADVSPDLSRQGSEYLHDSNLARSYAPAAQRRSEAAPAVVHHSSQVAHIPAGMAHSSLRMLHSVEMEVSVELGRARLAMRDLLELAPGSVVELDRPAGAPVDVLVNGTLLARGEVVVVDDEFGVRITELFDSADGAREPF